MSCSLQDSGSISWPSMAGSRLFRIHDLRAKRAVVLERALKDGVPPGHLPRPSDATTLDWQVPISSRRPQAPRHPKEITSFRSSLDSITSMFINALNPGPPGRHPGRRRPGRRRGRGRASVRRHRDGIGDRATRSDSSGWAGTALQKQSTPVPSSSPTTRLKDATTPSKTA